MLGILERVLKDLGEGFVDWVKERSVQIHLMEV
jgi:hypothetical protein